LVNEACPDAAPLLLAQAFALLAPNPQLPRDHRPPASLRFQSGTALSPLLPLPEALEQRLRARISAAAVEAFVTYAD
jgi:hypothetical protein